MVFFSSYKLRLLSCSQNFLIVNIQNSSLLASVSGSVALYIFRVKLFNSSCSFFSDEPGLSRANAEEEEEPRFSSYVCKVLINSHCVVPWQNRRGTISDLNLELMCLWSPHSEKWEAVTRNLSMFCRELFIVQGSLSSLVWLINMLRTMSSYNIFVLYN